MDYLTTFRNHYNLKSTIEIALFQLRNNQRGKMFSANKKIKFFLTILLLISLPKTGYCYDLSKAIANLVTGGLVGVASGYILEKTTKKSSFTDGLIYKNENSSNKKEITFDDIAGIDDKLIEIKEVMDFIKNPYKYKKIGAKLPKGILLCGPPGNGKTMIAQAIANEAGYNFMYESASSFVELFVGMGSRKIRQLFDKAKLTKKSTIIFLDEIDAIGCPNRGIGGNDEYRQTLNELLVQMDGFDSNNSIIVIGATNNAEALDKALKRPGRFTKIIEINNPNKTGRTEILNHYLNKLPVKPITTDIFLDNLSYKTFGFSAADLENIINEAALFAARKNLFCITETELDKAFEKISKQKSI